MPKQDLCRSLTSLGLRRERRRVSARLVALLVASMAVTSARGEWLFESEASLAYDSNLPRAAEVHDRRADFALGGVLRATSFIAPTGYDAIAFGAQAGADAFGRFHGLDNAFVETHVTYRHKWGLGATAPWAALEASAGYYGYDVDVRDGPRFAVRALAGKRFGAGVDTYAEIFADRRLGPEGEAEVPGISGRVFDLRGAGAAVGVEYAATSTLTLTARGSARRGDVVSTASPSLPIFLASTAIAEDRAFGEDAYAYRLRGTTYAVSLGASLALDARSSLTLAYAVERTTAAQSLDYVSRVASLTLLHNY